MCFSCLGTNLTFDSNPFSHRVFPACLWGPLLTLPSSSFSLLLSPPLFFWFLCCPCFFLPSLSLLSPLLPLVCLSRALCPLSLPFFFPFLLPSCFGFPLLFPASPAAPLLSCFPALALGCCLLLLRVCCGFLWFSCFFLLFPLFSPLCSPLFPLSSPFFPCPSPPLPSLPLLSPSFAALTYFRAPHRALLLALRVGKKFLATAVRENLVLA